MVAGSGRARSGRVPWTSRQSTPAPPGGRGSAPSISSSPSPATRSTSQSSSTPTTGCPRIDAEADKVLVPKRQRRFIRTLSEAEADADVDPGAGAERRPPPLPRPPSAPVPAAAPDLPPPAAAPPAPSAPALARIAIRRVRHGPAREDTSRLDTLEAATRAVRRSPSRERVGDLVVRAARELTGDALDAVVVFVVREPIAVGWKGVVVGAEPALDAIAVPLDEPNLVARAVGAGGPAELDLADATALDHRLIDALGGRPPSRAIAAPVLIAGHPVCLVYAHGAAVGAAADTVRALAEAAGTAFGRLLRAAQR